MGVHAEVFVPTLELLQSLCSQTSSSDDAEGLHAMARRLAAELEDSGLKTRIERKTDAGDRSLPILIAHRGDPSARPVVLVGHLDTVLTAAEPRLESDRLVATGAIDMKGGLAVFSGALRLLRLQGRRWPENLVLVVVPDEEIGGPVAAETVRKWGAEAGALLLLEPGEMRDEGETLVVGRRGLAEWTLEVTGRGAHSGIDYWQGRSALYAATEWCRRAAGLSELGSGPIVNPARMVAGDADFVDRLGTHHALLGGRHRLNVVPERARVEGEVRFLQPGDGPRMMSELEGLARSVAAEHSTRVDFTTGEVIGAVSATGPGGDLARWCVQHARRAGWQLELELDRGGVSLMNYVPDPNTVAVLDGLGPVGGGMHTRDEFVHLPSLDRRIELLAALLEKLADPRETP